MLRRGFLMRRLALAAALTLASGTALAGTVTVITSFPKELTAAYKAAFEKANPDIKVEILNKNTVAGIAFVRETANVLTADAPHLSSTPIYPPGSRVQVGIDPAELRLLP